MSGIAAVKCGVMSVLRVVHSGLELGSGLRLCHIESGAAKPATLQRVNQRRLVDQASARKIDDDRTRLHPRQLRPPDQTIRRIGQVEHQRKNVTLLRNRVNRLAPIGAVHPIHTIRQRQIAAAVTKHTHAEHLRTRCEREVWRRVDDHEEGQREIFVQDPDRYLLMVAHDLGRHLLRGGAVPP